MHGFCCRKLGVAAALTLATSVASAAVFCAHNTADIQAALTAAQANGEDDQIEITSGNIGASALTFSSTEGHSIELYGGYDGLNCDAQAADPTTSLDGQSTVRILYLHNPGGSVAIGGLTFTGGKAPSGVTGGALFIDGAALAYLAGDSFIGNRTTGVAGAVAITAGFVEFANNLVLANHGGQVGGVFLNLSGAGNVVVNNTIVANISDDASSPAGMSAVGAGSYTVGNNIIWNNAGPGGSDFGIFSTNTRKTNDIGIVKPGTAGSVSGELSVDPQFAPCSGFLCFNFELSPTSPLVDAGTDSIPMPFGQINDIAGKPRKLGPHIDIGAYEYDDRLFVNGFE